MSIKVIAKRSLFVLEKYAPEILTYGGLAAMIGGTVVACRQTPKAVMILDETKRQLIAIEQTHDEAEEHNGQVAKYDEQGNLTMISYSKKDYQKDLTIAHVNNVKDLAKTYAVPAVMILGGAACILGGHGILRRRNAVAIATLGSVMEGFNKYRQNVIADQGEDADKKYRFGLPAPKTFETVNVETGEITQESVEPIGFKDIDEYDPRVLKYSKETCPEYYKGNLLADMAHLKSAQVACNDKLRMFGHLTVNEAREIIGAKAIPEGLDNGWVIDGDGDGNVDFNLFDPLTGEIKAWVYNQVDTDQGIPVEFNIDGNIKGFMKRPRNCR